MHRIGILTLLLSAGAFAQAPQVPDTTTFQQTRTAFNAALTSLFNSRSGSGVCQTNQFAVETNSGGVRCLAVDWAVVVGKPTTFVPTQHAPSHLPGGMDSIPLWGNGSRPVAGNALGTPGNCAQWGVEGLVDDGGVCDSLRRAAVGKSPGKYCVSLDSLGNPTLLDWTTCGGGSGGGGPSTNVVTWNGVTMSWNGTTMTWN